MSKQFVDLLLKEQLITQGDHNSAQEAFQKSKTPHLKFLQQHNLIQENKITEYFAKKYSIPSFDLSKYVIDPEVVKILTAEDARRFRLIPLQKAKGTLVVALADPTALSNLDDIKFRTQMKIEAVITTLTAFDMAMDKYYGAMNLIEKQVKADEAGAVEDIGGLQEEALEIKDANDIDAPIIQLVNQVLVDAIKKKASDIHIEPYETSFRIRIRIDGALYEAMKPPFQVKNAVIARIKIMAKMDIAEKRLPQDGRIKIRTPFGEMDFRVSSMPTVFGEKMVLRLLNKGGLQTDLLKLGFEKAALESFTEAIHESYGMVLVTGPTGSGKTTTLYSALQELNKLDSNISTAEDPVEYNLEGINQVQIHSDIGLNFAAALRTFMRQDPDIILVGEVRDFETAEVSVQAALTGHLVLSTLHTNDAPSSITRLLNMGVEPFLVTAAVNLICAQRLVRRICPNCKVEAQVPVQRLMDLGIDPGAAKQMKIFRGAGCALCSNTGYQGRFGIYEVMPFSSLLKEAVLAGANSLELKKKALDEGMKSLRMSALTKVAEGMTTLEEALTSTASDF
ncbi:MAG TPA: type IV-A pilus assembly ATPase PilB [Bdellovibrionota bacterium]|jgi:type IV pilus assembly protein PilB